MNMPWDDRDFWIMVLILVLVLAAVMVLPGCVSAETRTSVANSAATSWEAAEAIDHERGPSPETRVIKQNATATAHAMGYEYPSPAPKGTP